MVVDEFVCTVHVHHLRLRRLRYCRQFHRGNRCHGYDRRRRRTGDVVDCRCDELRRLVRATGDVVGGGGDGTTNPHPRFDPRRRRLLRRGSWSVDRRTRCEACRSGVGERRRGWASVGEPTVASSAAAAAVLVRSEPCGSRGDLECRPEAIP